MEKKKFTESNAKIPQAFQPGMGPGQPGAGTQTCQMFWDTFIDSHPASTIKSIINAFKYI